MGGLEIRTWCDHVVRASRNFGVAWFCFLSIVFLPAQETPEYVVLQTGGGQSLINSQQLLQTGGVPNPAVFFDFGFFTDEIVAPGVFLDSFTVTIQDSSSAVAVLVTADASGSLWAPLSPGAIFLSDFDIERKAFSPPTLDPIFGRGVGFSVGFLLPEEFTGPSVTVHFDLFDNQDGLMSGGWYSQPHIESVPEPHSAWLLTFGLLMAGLRWKRNK
jgi:hypothetical protein